MPCVVLLKSLEVLDAGVFVEVKMPDGGLVLLDVVLSVKEVSVIFVIPTCVSENTFHNNFKFVFKYKCL